MNKSKKAAATEKNRWGFNPSGLGMPHFLGIMAVVFFTFTVGDAIAEILTTIWKYQQWSPFTFGLIARG